MTVTSGSDTNVTRVVVCGGVAWTDAATIHAELERFRGASGAMEIVTGMADGADRIARTWAVDNSVACVAKRLDPGPYPRPMHTYNEQMLAMNPDVVLAFKSNFGDTTDRIYEPGTEHMVRIAREAGVPVLVFDRSAADHMNKENEP